MTDVNLLDTDRISRLREKRHDRKLKKIRLTIIVICAAVLIVLGLIFTILKIANSTLSTSIKQNEITLSELQGDELNRNLTIQKTLFDIDDFHNQKQSFSILLSLIRQLNVGAEYKNITINSDNKIVVSGLVADFTMLDSLKNSLKNAKVSYESEGQKYTDNLFNSVDIAEGATESDKRVNFRINTDFNPNIVKFGIVNVELEKKGGGNE